MKHLSNPKREFNKIVKGFSEDLEHQGIYGKENKQKALDMTLNEILEGYRDLEEAKESVKTLRETEGVFYTARGIEVNADALEEAIKIREIIPSELQTLAKEARKYKSAEEFASYIYDDLTPKDIKAISKLIGYPYGIGKRPMIEAPKDFYNRIIKGRDIKFKHLD